MKKRAESENNMFLEFSHSERLYIPSYEEISLESLSKFSLFIQILVVSNEEIFQYFYVFFWTSYMNNFSIFYSKFPYI